MKRRAHLLDSSKLWSPRWVHRGCGRRYRGHIPLSRVTHTLRVGTSLQKIEGNGKETPTVGAARTTSGVKPSCALLGGARGGGGPGEGQCSARPRVQESLPSLPACPLSLYSLPCLSCSPADEMTVGKVYAALMIFDFYKQNKTTRDQIHQAPGGLAQVPVSRSPQK